MPCYCCGGFKEQWFNNFSGTKPHGILAWWRQTLSSVAPISYANYTSICDKCHASFVKNRKIWFTKSAVIKPHSALAQRLFSSVCVPICPRPPMIFCFWMCPDCILNIISYCYLHAISYCMILIENDGYYIYISFIGT